MIIFYIAPEGVQDRDTISRHSITYTQDREISRNNLGATHAKSRKWLLLNKKADIIKIKFEIIMIHVDDLLATAESDDDNVLMMISLLLVQHTCEPSCGNIFLPILRVPSVPPINFQNLPPVKKIKYNKILTYILRSIFLEIPY